MKHQPLKWQTINDTIAYKMLSTLYDNLTDDALLEEYSEQLEKRYRKPSGTISDYIFQQDLSVEEIMILLRKDEVTYL